MSSGAIPRVLCGARMLTFWHPNWSSLLTSTAKHSNDLRHVGIKASPVRVETEPYVWRTMTKSKKKGSDKFLGGDNPDEQEERQRALVETQLRAKTLRV